MDFIVKNTTRISILDLFLPYSCRGCGKTGEVLCERCKKYLLGKSINSARIKKDGGEIRLGQLKEFCAVGYREGVLRRLVVEYKYSARRAVSSVLGELVSASLIKTLFNDKESISGNVVLVPLPTISRHIRERGFDHTARLANEVVNSTGLQVERVLRRANNTTQVGADEVVRARQAKEAYEVVGEIEKEKTYLLLDDIWTTGASMRAAAEKLYNAGARKIYGVVICKGR